ncbi:MAG: PEP-CTERM sorting domain-containing protein [Armatimonadetes bacterium]|nr:PEP-CTERM sorting domain-containing protein [Armatimonadota bacterium]
MKRTLLVGMSLGIIGQAHATFDLIFVADVGTDSIHRFDGDSGVYLGTIGNGALVDPQSIQIDKVNNRLFVGAANGFFQFDLWSGTLVNAIGVYNITHLTEYAPGQNLGTFTSSLNWFGGFIPNFDGYYNGMFMPASSVYGGITKYQGNLMAADITGSRVRSYSTTSWGGTATVINTYLTTTNGGYGQMMANGTYFGVADGGNNRVHYAHSGYASGSTMPWNTVDEASVIKGLAFAHGNTYYASGRNFGNTSGALYRRSLGVGGTLGTYGTGILQQPRDIAVMIAPEPGVYLGFGVGLAGLLLRRRRK